MAGLFGPKVPKNLPVVNPADTQNRINSGLANRLAAGGSNADAVTQGGGAGTGAGRMPTLTGLN